MKKIFIYPKNNSENLYINIYKNIYQELGFKIINKMIFNCNIIHLNWFESYHVSNKFLAFLKFIQRYVILQIILILRIRIIFTFHNKEGHELNTRKYSALLMKKIIKKSNKIIILSKVSREILTSKYKVDPSKIFYIQHPNYVNLYGPIQSDESHQRLNVLFFGQIKPYKNIEVIIEVAKKHPNIDFHIVGKPISNIYKNELKRLISNLNNVYIDMRFIHNDEIPSLFSKSDILLFPYDMDSILNSGSIILACSYKKTFISPIIGTINDFNDRELFYSYSYEKNNHISVLSNVIGKVHGNYMIDRNVLKFKGKQLYKYVKEYNSHDLIKLKIKNMLGDKK